MLKTEIRNSRTTHIDRMSTAEMVRVMQDENINAAKSIENALTSIERAIDAIVERMAKGGRLFYIGCGTSGRLGVLDASECPPTMGSITVLLSALLQAVTERSKRPLRARRIA